MSLSNKPEELNREQLEQTKKDSITEGCAASVMIGLAEQFLIPFSIYLGAGVSWVAILSSVPLFIASCFQLFGAYITDELEDRKKIVMWGALLQAIVLLPLFIIPFLSKSIFALMVFFTAYLAIGNIIGPSWNSWLGDIIPMDERAKYFSLRNKVVILFLMASVLVGGIVLQIFNGINTALGFGIIFFSASLSRVISSHYFTKHYEPRYHSDIWSEESFFKFLSEIKETPFGNFVRFRSLFALAVMISAPFFSIYMLKNLEFNYVEFSIILLAPMLVKALAMTYWGEISTRFGNRKIMRMSAILISFIPLMWIFFGETFGRAAITFWLILFTEFFTGFSWAGFELTSFNYMLSSTPSKKRAKLFAYFSMIHGFMVLVGSFLGIFLMKFLPVIVGSLHVFFWVYFISTVVRLFFTLSLFPKIKDLENHEKITEKRLFYEVLLSRPMGYVTHLPLARLIFLSDQNRKNR